MAEIGFKNPFRPGAGHTPPYLAGRVSETAEFRRLLTQDTILEHMVLTGLRGVGKTVLLDTFKPIAIEGGWRWVGTDLSESASVSEDRMALRLLTDLSVVTSSIVVGKEEWRQIGFVSRSETVEQRLGFEALVKEYEETPGLVSDKLKAVLELVWSCLSRGSDDAKGIIFAYDEAQILSDQAKKEQYPLSILLDIFQSIQRKDIPFMLVLTGLPTLFPKLVEARTFAERMFHVVFLDRLTEEESRDAIQKPLEAMDSILFWAERVEDTIVDLSGGYPYFIQFICREVLDALNQRIITKGRQRVPVDEIIRKLDTDFFAGRWSKATDRQRELLEVIAKLDNSDAEFTVQEVVERSKTELEKPFSSSHVNQMLASLADVGLVYKNRHGKYSFAVPLLGGFILRQIADRKLH